MFSLEILQENSIELLKNLIETPSLSREEDKTASLIESFFTSHGVVSTRVKNNVIAKNLYFDESKPTILLNSHHDTVKPNSGYTKDPFKAIVEKDVLYGLGSNDAGGCLVSLIATFLHFYDQSDLRYNFILLASAEEEISGKEGVALVVPELPEIDFGIIGEPTEMNAAISEKGLMVLDCIAHGKAGHAAREEGVNAIYQALEDIHWFQTFQFPKQSLALGPVKMSVTVIEAGKQHNVVPDQCRFVVDVRTIDAYSNQKTLALIKEHVKCDVNARSTRLNPSSIDSTHPIVKAACELGATTYGSPTLSDQALMNGFPTLKMGPGKSERSHTADEFIYLAEIKNGIEFYIKMLEKIV